MSGQINQNVNVTPLNCINDSTNTIQLNVLPGLNESGVYIWSRKTQNLNTLDGHRKNYLFIRCGYKNKSPKNIEYWFDSITEFSFCTRRVKKMVDFNVKEVPKVSNEESVLFTKFWR